MPETVDDFFKKCLEILPDAQFEEDNDGQLIIYTNHKVVEIDGRHYVKEMEERE